MRMVSEADAIIAGVVMIAIAVALMIIAVRDRIKHPELYQHEEHMGFHDWW